MTEPSEPIDHLIRRTIISACGIGPAWLIDIDDVRRIGTGVLGVGDSRQDGCVTVDSSDRVTVWADGDSVATAHVAGSFAHYAQRALDTCG